MKRAGLERASDDAVWEFARRGRFVIVTLDADFADIAALRGAPPKVIWLHCGNRTTAFVERLLRDRVKAIEAFVDSADAACLELY